MRLRPIPLFVSGKSPYFDRTEQKKVKEIIKKGCDKKKKGKKRKGKKRKGWDKERKKEK